MLKRKPDHKTAIVLTCFVAFLWSTAGLNIKMIVWNPLCIAGGRSLIAVAMLFPVILKNENVQINRYVIGGAVCYAAFNYSFNISTKLATSALAILMQYTAPVYVAILSWVFLKERISRADILCIAAVMAGMIVFFLGSEGGGSVPGKIIAVFNGITFAGISIFLRLQKDGNPVMSMFLGNILAGIVGIPFIVSVGLPNLKSVLFLILAGFLCAFTYSLYAIASTHLSALETVLLPILDPVLNPVWVFLFLGEAPSSLSVLGFAIVLISVTARTLFSLHRDSEKEHLQVTGQNAD
ncbi:MAG: DMT family transporter [Lachnospiraceae bacterium]|nr:DMT family transporter [Lachnospiraceae bacterium]